MNDKSHDDLTAIKGIGKVWQSRLQESLGVRTFQDLADLSCDEMISRLKEKNQPAPSRSDCEAWLTQARQLAAAIPASASSAAEDTKEIERSRPKNKNWKPFASFVVEYLTWIGNGESDRRRTTVHFVEGDQDQKWERIATDEPCNWMLKEASQSKLASAEMKEHIEEVRTQKQRELKAAIEEQRLAAARGIQEEQALARKELQQELENYQTQFKQEMERRLADDHAQALETLQKELAKQRRAEMKQLQEQLENERSQAEKNLTQILEKKRKDSEKSLERQLDETRTRAREDLLQELDQERSKAEEEMAEKREAEDAKALEALSKAFAEQRAQAVADLQRDLEAERAKAREELQKELAQERTRAKEALEKQLVEQSEAAQKELEQKLYEIRGQAMGQLEQEMEEGPLPMTTESTAGPVAVEELEPLPETAVETQPVAARPAPPPINIPRINVEITSLQAFQPIEAQEATLVGLPGQSFSGTLSSGIGFAMQVDFELAEPATGTIVDPQITHYAQVFAQDSSTGRKFHLGDSRPASFINSESRYVARLTNMKLDSGTYDLNIFVAVQGGRQIADHARVSLLVSDN